MVDLISFGYCQPRSYHLPWTLLPLEALIRSNALPLCDASLGSRKASLEQVMGIEPTSSAWKADVLADVLYLHIAMAYIYEELIA